MSSENQYPVARPKGRPRNDEGDPVALAYALLKDDEGYPFKCTPYQSPIMRAIVSRQHHHIIFIAATQSGKTTLVGASIPLLAMIHPNSQIPIISYTKAQTKIMFNKIKRHFTKDNEHVANLIDFEQPFTSEEMHLKNGSKISCLTAGVNSKGDQLLGFNGTDVFLDESVLISDEIYNEKIVRMLGSTLRDGSRRMLVELTTPQKLGHTYDAWKKGNCLKFKTTWREAVAAGRLNAEFIAQRQEEWSPLEFNIWYNCEWPTNGEGRLIKPDWIEMCKQLPVPDEKPLLTVLGADISRHGCFDDKTEILTDEGWKFFNNVTGTERILSTEKNSTKSEWMPITHKHEYDFDGFLNVHDRRSLSFAITDNHNLVTRTSTTSELFKLEQFDNLPNEFVLKNNVLWEGNNPKTKTFTSVCHMPNGGDRIKSWTFDWNDWMEFLGWYVAEGSTYIGPHSKTQIRVAQKKKLGIKRLWALFNRMNLKVRRTSDDSSFELSNKEICNYLRKNVKTGAPNKRIPKDVMDSSRESINSFLKGYCWGDGTITKKGTKVYFTTSKLLADDVHELLVKIGRSGKITKRDMNGTTAIIEGRTIYRHHDIYVINETKRQCANKYVLKKNVNKQYYKGKVYCVSTPYKTICVRRNGTVMWSGNSDYTAFTLVRSYDKGIYDVPFIHYFRNSPITNTAGKLIKFARQFDVDYVGIDDLGVGGGVTDTLRDVDDIRGRVRAFQASSRPIDRKRYYNRKTEVYMEMATLFRKGLIHIPDHPMLMKDLNVLTPPEFNNTRGLLKITDPSTSPDFADSLSIALAQFPMKKSQPKIIPFGSTDIKKKKATWLKDIPYRVKSTKVLS